jgi:hypothetical protein
MTSLPPTQPVSQATRVLAAVIIALAALGITWLAHRWIRQSPAVLVPPTSGKVSNSSRLVARAETGVGNETGADPGARS